MKKKIKSINEKYLGYTVRDIKYILMMLSGMMIFCFAGIKYRQFMGLIVGFLTILTALYLFIRESEKPEADDNE